MIENAEVDPFLRLTRGITVFTDDDQKIGTISDLKDRHFEVDAGLLRKNYWLPAECIDAVLPGDRVILRIAKAEIDEYKVSSLSKAA